VNHLPRHARLPAILTTAHVRPALRELIASEFPGIAVVSYRELAPGLNIQPIARIGTSN
jgi:type III secretory pathway component EscV